MFESIPLVGGLNLWFVFSLFIALPATTLLLSLWINKKESSRAYLLFHYIAFSTASLFLLIGLLVMAITLGVTLAQLITNSFVIGFLALVALSALFLLCVIVTNTMFGSNVIWMEDLSPATYLYRFGYSALVTLFWSVFAISLLIIMITIGYLVAMAINVLVGITISENIAVAIFAAIFGISIVGGIIGQYKDNHV